ncbi:MAG: 50S ribosomal protein L10 [Desulfomonilaceae bacterium]|nr:50S ribosomal protein L10 [Desulfomonilaceae bacterium]
MTREEKAKQVEWFREQFQDVSGLFLADYKGLSVEDMNALRRELRPHGVAFKVLKNTLVRLAYKDTVVAVLEDDVVGTRAAAWTHSEENVPTMAKVLVSFAKTHPKFEVVRGVLGGQKVEPSEVEALSKLPSREQLLGILLGTAMAPVSAFVGTLAAVPRSFLTVLKAIEEQKATAGESAPV